MQILKLMKRLLIAPLAVRLPLTCLIACASLSCAGLRKFPVERLWEFDAKSNVCAEYKIVNYSKFTYKWLRDVPRAECPSIFGFKSDQIPMVLNWGQDAVAYGKNHCR